MIFHYPLRIADGTSTGRTVHVEGMLRGMRAIADVDVVEGYSKDRIRSMRSVWREVQRGVRYDAVFSEASTTPTSLNDPHHLPLHPIADANFFRRLRSRRIPVGLFYPDVHWRFEHYRDAVRPVVRLATTAVYRYDLLWYRRTVDALFLPSMRMAESVPGWGSDPRVGELFPGGEDDPLPWSPTPGVLRLLYVGGVVPPLYDVTDLLDAVTATPDVQIVVCCPAEQRVHLARYEGRPDVEIVHESGARLERHYRECDATCLVYPDYEYRRFAMPVKLFESIGAGRPVIASAGNAAAEFVSENQVGWVVEPDRDAVAVVLSLLRTRPSELASARQRVLDVAPENTWEQRARSVLARLGVPAVTCDEAR